MNVQDLFALEKKGHLRFNISMENTVSVHMFDGFKELINVELDPRLWQVSRSALDRFI